MGKPGRKRRYNRGLAGVGKSTLVNHWLRRTAAKHYHSAKLVFGAGPGRPPGRGIFQNAICTMGLRYDL
jgi:GTPase SAR1 family protein